MRAKRISCHVLCSNLKILYTPPMCNFLKTKKIEQLKNLNPHFVLIIRLVEGKERKDVKHFKIGNY